MDGTSARVLDYAANWIHPDGSSSMLEHEILRIQSQEAARAESERAPPSGLVLRFRVRKPDGRSLEPVPVGGKATLTMPHLEVGDYLEVEHVTPLASDGERGRRYRGPHWFFREADKGYWRSELVVLSPRERTLDVETVGTVPAPKVVDRGSFVERRWRVDESPPAPEEPDGPRPTEFLPSVRIGWGVRLDDALRRAADNVAYEVPLDPRLATLAERIVRGTDPRDVDGRAQRIYRWVLANVQDGNETDGRRAVLGKAGSREAAFEHLCRELRLPLDRAVVKNRLSMPPRGPMTEVEAWDAMLLRLDTPGNPRWLTVGPKFAPYGYVPAELRNQPAIVLKEGFPRETTGGDGSADGVRFEGNATVRDDGSADVRVDQVFSGKLAISMRNVFAQVPEAQTKDFVESRLIGRYFSGARLRTVEVLNRNDDDEPLRLRMRAEVPQLVRARDGAATLKSLFPIRLSQLSSLPERKTPLVLGGSSHVTVHFDIDLGTGFRLQAAPPSAKFDDGDRTVRIDDGTQGATLRLRRVADIPAARIAPGSEYSRFARFTQASDAAWERELPLERVTPRP
jgi:hypothetical protein